MEYKIVFLREVKEKLQQIDKYCIENFGNYNFSITLYNEIVRATNRLRRSPFMYPKVNNMHKIPLKNGYTLYYYVEENYVYIDSLKGRGERSDRDE